MSKDNLKNSRPGKLGTFSGVFTPSVLTILGIILFRRMGFVVGSSGLGTALVIICIANLISILTSFSLAAISTNMKVKGGGDYYLISRTLGKEFGGAIGLVLFLAQSVSIGFYCIGFGEAVEGIAASSGLNLSTQVIAFVALLFLFVLAWVGADLATKFQYGVMAFLILALVSFYAGGIGGWDAGVMMANWSVSQPALGFWPLFAIFFPAVTGFTQGVSMSGDLENPGKSIPSGTFAAVGLSILVYVSAALVFAGSSPSDSLVSDYGVMKKTAVLGVLIDAGVIAATLSSAMASFLGAPRILQSLATDKIFHILNLFEKGAGPGNNPRRAVLFSFILALAVISLGQLDLIAGIVSMFFLLSYGLLNYATYYEASAQSPSFRPRFKWYSRYVSMAGFLACLGVMLSIDIKTGIAAAAILLSVYQYLKQVKGPDRWADSKRSHFLQQVRSGLIQASRDMEHPREWRPYILTFSHLPESFPGLLRFSTLIEGGSGITTAVRLVRAKGARAMKLRQSALEQLKKEILDQQLQAFALCLSTMDSETAMDTLFQSYGLGPVKANTVVFDWQEMEKIDKAFIKSAAQAKCNTLLVNGASKALPGPDSDQKIQRIDVWWNNDDSSRLLLLLAYLSTRGKPAESARINLLAVNYDRENSELQKELSDILEDYRIDAAPSIVLGLDSDTLVSKSKDADMVFLPFTLKDDACLILSRFAPQDILNRLSFTVMAMAAIPVDLDAAPEEGPAGELAAVYDELEHAVSRAATAQKRAAKTADAAKEKLAAINEHSGPIDPDAQKLINAINQQVLTARKKALKEKARVETLSQEARDKGIDPPLEDHLEG